MAVVNAGWVAPVAVVKQAAVAIAPAPVVKSMNDSLLLKESTENATRYSIKRVSILHINDFETAKAIAYIA